VSSTREPVPGLVDVHTHVLDPDLPDLNARYPGVWPVVSSVDSGRARISLGGKPYRTVDERCWSVPRRLADMDADGVAVQVLSPMPVTLAHGADPAGAVELARAQNTFLAGLVAQAPDRLRAFGAVPLQDPEAAVAELRRCVLEFGFLGVEIGTRAGSLALTDPRFDPFFAAAASLAAVVFVHPVDQDADPRLTGLGLGFGAGMPTETGIAAAGLLSAPVAARRPGVRLLLAHGGGTLPSLLPRLDQGERLADRQATEVASVRARSVYCDSLTYDADALDVVLARFGETHVLLGTDYPFPARERPAGAVLAAREHLRATVGRAHALSLVDTVAAERAAATESRKGASWATSWASA
jgi:aminocarboxymuconate-semialdehyde decarboxylase